MLQPGRYQAVLFILTYTVFLYVYILADAASYLDIQEGASDADIGALQKYRFQMSNEKAGSGRLIPLPTSSDLLATERTVLREDAVSVVYVYVSNQNLIDIKL